MNIISSQQRHINNYLWSVSIENIGRSAGVVLRHVITVYAFYVITEKFFRNSVESGARNGVGVRASVACFIM